MSGGVSQAAVFRYQQGRWVKEGMLRTPYLARRRPFFGLDFAGDVDHDRVFAAGPGSEGLRDSIYVFTKEQGGWIREAELFPHSPPTPSEVFLHFLVLRASGDRIACTSWKKGIYIFERDAEGWSETAHISDYDYQGMADLEGDRLVDYQGFVYECSSAGAWSSKVQLVGSGPEQYLVPSALKGNAVIAHEWELSNYYDQGRIVFYRLP